VNELLLANGTITLSCESGIACIGARTLILENSSLSVMNSLRSFTAHHIIVQDSNLTVQYAAISTLELITGTPVLHLGEIAFIEDFPTQVYEVVIANQTVKLDSSQVHGLLMTVPSSGNVSASFRIPRLGITGSICWGQSNLDVFDVGSGESFYGHVRLCNYRTTQSAPLSTRSPALQVEAHAEQDSIDSGTILRISLGGAVFLLMVVGVILLATLKSRCDFGSDNAAIEVPVVSLAGNYTADAMD
jgi:hypothetical protein